ncbi:MAG: TAXI family TRAP transporter solute-binding subunit [Clostridiales bacterium]|nr:TAXI family TRAP transporter solute-binding subunit [Clostridiales bacterium]
MKKKIAFFMVLILLVSLIVVGCGETEDISSEEVQFVTIATGGSAGAYFALGGTVAKLLNENLENVNASVQSTGASAVNSTLMGEGKIEVAFAMNDVVSYAFTGTEVFADKGKFDNIRGIASLYPNFVQIITLERSGIKEIEDMRGKRIGVGAPGSGTEVNARQILAAHGITYDDIDEDFLSYAEAAEQMKNGAIDAAFLTSGIPNAAVLDLATTQDVVIVPIRREIIENSLAKEFPFYSPEEIPGGMYDQAEAVPTAAVTTILITRAELSEELVYNITKTIFENLEALGNTHASGKKIDLAKVRIAMPVPLHPGAEKYFSELGK